MPKLGGVDVADGIAIANFSDLTHSRLGQEEDFIVAERRVPGLCM